MHEYFKPLVILVWNAYDILPTSLNGLFTVTNQVDSRLVVKPSEVNLQSVQCRNCEILV